MAAMMKSIELSHNVGKRKKNEDAESEYLSQNKKKARRVVWSADLDSKFVNAVKLLGEQNAAPKKIVALMNVDGITTAHVASHLQKYRLRKKKAADAERVRSRMIPEPTQSQNINIPSSFNFPANQQTSTLLHPSHTLPAEIYSNISEVPPSTLIQSQHINNSPLIIHPPPSTFPTYHHISTFPTLVNQSTTQLGLATAFDFNDVGTFVGFSSSKSTSINSSFNTEDYSSAGLNMSGVAPSTLIQPTQSQNINIHPPQSTFPIYHQTSSLFATLVNQSTTPLGFPTTFHFHDNRATTNCPLQIPYQTHDVVTPASSKTTSIWDYNWYAKYMKREPQLLKFAHNSLPVWESDKTSQMNSQTSTFGAACLGDTNIDISDYNLCTDNSPIDFSVFDTNCNTLEWGCLEEENQQSIII